MRRMRDEPARTNLKQIAPISTCVAGAERLLSRTWRNFPKGYTLALLAVLLVNLWRDLATVLPQQLSDETAFLLSAKYFSQWDLVFSLGYRPVPGLLFLKLTSFLTHSDRYYELAKAMNALWMTLTAVPAWFVARRVMPADQARVASLLVALMPATIYGAYFTPEATYIFLFWLFAAVSVAALEMPNRASPVLACGALCAVAYLVKPHAVALAAAYVVSATVLCIAAPGEPGADATIGRRLRTAITHVALFAVGMFVALLLLGRLLGESWLASFDLRLYSELVTRKVAFEGSVAAMSDIVQLLVLHAAAVATALAIPMLALAAFRPRGVAIDRRWRVLAVFSCAVVSMLILMTAKATIDFHTIHGGSNTLDRLHGRYYAFALPLLVFAGIGWSRHRLPGASSMWHPVAGVLVAAIIVICIACTGRQAFTFLDSPDLAYLLGTPGRGTWLAAVVLIGVAIVLARSAAGWLSIGGWALMSLVNIDVATALQHNEDRAQTGDRAVGVLQDLFPRADLDRGVVVAGAYPVAAARAAFRLASTSPVVSDLHDAKSRANRSTEWILVLGDRSGSAFEWKAIVAGDSTLYVAHAARILPSVHPEGGRVAYSFLADGASAASATPANAPESWGTWLSGAAARISFPAPLPDRGTLIIVASVLDPARQSPVELSICGKTYPVSLTAVLAAHRVEYACATHPDQVLIAGMKPLSPRDLGLSSDRRVLALGLRSIEVEPAGR